MQVRRFSWGLLFVDFCRFGNSAAYNVRLHAVLRHALAGAVIGSASELNVTGIIDKMTDDIQLDRDVWRSIQLHF